MKQVDADNTGAGYYNVATMKGQYVKRKESANKVYRVIGFDREYGWQLDDTDDISRCTYVKSGTLVFAGFDY